MNRTELLKLIGDGAYGADIPDDDATMEVLAQLAADGFVVSEPCRLDDFFYLTQAGIQQLEFR
jgi:hypothetical protein